MLPVSSSASMLPVSSWGKLLVVGHLELLDGISNSNEDKLNIFSSLVSKIASDHEIFTLGVF